MILSPKMPGRWGHKARSMPFEVRLQWFQLDSKKPTEPQKESTKDNKDSNQNPSKGSSKTPQRSSTLPFFHSNPLMIPSYSYNNISYPQAKPFTSTFAEIIVPSNKNAPVNMLNVKDLLSKGEFKRSDPKKSFDSMRQAGVSVWVLSGCRVGGWWRLWWRWSCWYWCLMVFEEKW